MKFFKLILINFFLNFCLDKVAPIEICGGRRRLCADFYGNSKLTSGKLFIKMES